MTRDDIVRMAQECQLIGMRPHLDGIYQESLERFAALVLANTPPQSSMAWQEGYEAGRLAEREACAKVCEDDFGNGALNLAAAIRARGNT